MKERDIQLFIFNEKIKDKDKTQMKIVMDAPDYFAEHKRLINMLIKSHKSELIKEAKKQIKEVKMQKEKIENRKYGKPDKKK